MSNLLELVEVKESADLAASYENTNERKEVYIKALILEALRKKLDFIQTDDSLFYSKKFYAYSNLFDFYVNNNVFDLVILKPDTNELLFNSARDEVHSNIYGYVVVRLANDLKTAEIAGYFMSKDFEKIVNDGIVDIEALKDINTLKDIDTLEVQMSLEDISESFFDLVSKFLDGEIAPKNMSELACLLYNSSELRQVFAEIGRFENICSDIKDNQDLLKDDFLSVLAGRESNEDKEDEEDEIFWLEDLDELVEEEAQSIQPEDINLGLNLSELAQEFDKADENTATEDTQEFSVNENAVENDSVEYALGEQDDALLNEDKKSEQEAEQEDLLLEENELPLQETEQEDLLLDENDVSELEAEPDDNPSILETEKESEKLLLEEDAKELDLTVDKLETESVASEETEETEQVSTAEEQEDTDLLLVFDEQNNLEQQDNILEETEASSDTEQEESLLKLDNDDMDLEFDDIDLDNLEELDKKDEEPVVKSNLATELAKLSASKTQETDFPEEEKDLSETNQSTSSENETISAGLDDEILSILEDSSDENVIVDENELLSILGVEKENETIEDNSGETENDSNESVEVLTSNSLDNDNKENFVEDLDIESSEEKSSDVVETLTASDDELQLLYAEENSATAGTFPGDGIVVQEKKSLFDNSKTKTIVLASLLTLLVIGGSVSLILNKGTNSDNEIAKGLPQNTGNTPADDFSLPTEPQNMSNNMGMPQEQLPNTDVTADNSSDTKIVSSLSKQAGAAPVILKAVAWQVPSSMTNDAVFSKYLQIAGKNIKLNLATDLLGTNDFAYNNKIKISMTVKNNAPVKNVKIVESSGSKDVDDIVLQSIKQTLKYINSPVMSTDTGDREVVLVISI